MKNNKGFTLLEMIVVVMIIAVLFLLTIPNVSKVMGTVDSKACDAQCKVIDSAAIQYRLEYDEMPNSITDLVSAGLIEENQTTCSDGKSIYFEDGRAVHE